MLAKASSFMAALATVASQGNDGALLVQLTRYGVAGSSDDDAATMMKTTNQLSLDDVQAQQSMLPDNSDGDLSPTVVVSTFVESLLSQSHMVASDVMKLVHSKDAKSVAGDCRLLKCRFPECTLPAQ